MLDGHFGHLKTLRHKQERKKVERRSVEDLLHSMANAEATHVVHVKLKRDAESRFYTTGKGIDDLHRVSGYTRWASGAAEKIGRSTRGSQARSGQGEADQKCTTC